MSSITEVPTAELVESIEAAEEEVYEQPPIEEVDVKELGGLVHQFIRVTPELAAYWLTKNTHNRRIYYGVVREYASAMAEGRWDFDGDPIQFSKEGILLNGQHRLMAQVAVKATIVHSVWYNLPNHVQTVMDTGRKRSFSDVLSLEGVGKESGHVAALTGMLFYYDHGSRGQQLTSYQNFNGNRAQHRQLLDFFKDNEDEIRAAVPQAVQANKQAYAPVRLAAFANLLFRRIDEGDADAFMTALITGVGLEAENPILLLRQRLVQDYGTKSKMVRPQPWATLALMIKAWNYWRDGESIRLLGFKPGGANKELFPEPH